MDGEKTRPELGYKAVATLKVQLGKGAYIETFFTTDRCALF